MRHHIRFLILAGLISLLLPLSALGDIYKCVENGRTLFSDKPCASASNNQEEVDVRDATFSGGYKGSQKKNDGGETHTPSKTSAKKVKKSKQVSHVSYYDLRGKWSITAVSLWPQGLQVPWTDEPAYFEFRRGGKIKFTHNGPTEEGTYEIDGTTLTIDDGSGAEQIEIVEFTSYAMTWHVKTEDEGYWFLEKVD